MQNLITRAELIIENFELLAAEYLELAQTNSANGFIDEADHYRALSAQYIDIAQHASMVSQIKKEDVLTEAVCALNELMAAQEKRLSHYKSHGILPNHEYISKLEILNAKFNNVKAMIAVYTTL